MKKSRPKIEIEPNGFRKAVAYARVSSKEQEKEGFSIPAQQKLLTGYAQANRFTIAKEYIDVETAKLTGRTNFEEMVRYLRKHDDIRVVLVEKTDRLYRNLKDWVTVDELDVEIHMVKEGVVLSRDSKSSEKFVHGIKVLMAKNYIDNLSEEARKGQQEKAEQGIWPSKAPLGYKNVVGIDGKKIIIPDPAYAPLIAQLFEWYAPGILSLKEVSEKARAAGIVNRRTGAPMPVSNIHVLLRNRLFTGDFDWNGRRYKGKHQPLVTRELWQRVQDILDSRNARKIRKAKNHFAFSGLMNCGHCGCAMTADIKKERYIYYHCTGFKGKCDEPYVREEVVAEKFADILGQLTFGEETLAWVTGALRQSHADERAEHETAIARLRAEHDRLQNRLHAMYVDKLDGRITNSFYVQMSEQWQVEQDALTQEIARHQAADRSYLDEGARLIEVAQGAKRLFVKQKPEAQRKLLDFVLSNSTWKDGALTPVFRQPFDFIAETALAARKNVREKAASADGHPSWLGDLDSNQD